MLWAWRQRYFSAPTSTGFARDGPLEPFSQDKPVRGPYWTSRCPAAGSRPARSCRQLAASLPAATGKLPEGSLNRPAVQTII